MRLNSAFRSHGSGVVYFAGTSMASISVWMVPMSPALQPACSSVCLMSVVTVVFPLVPVTATRRSFSAGRPKKFWHSCAYALRPEATCTSPGRPSGRSVTMHTAPASSALRAWSCPSVVMPLAHTNTAPGQARRESCVTSTASPCGSVPVYGTPLNNTCNSMDALPFRAAPRGPPP